MTKDPVQFLPACVLDTVLQKYRPVKTEPILAGGIARLKPTQQRLMMTYGLVIQEVSDDEVVTSYARWLECVQVKKGLEPEVSVAFSPRFEPDLA